ncbi:RICIN domain-containing protein [Lentzea aerocolonigenes]|uniref:RICIN domain-containing protein n=1 Tax=Lentzea aerocolonigenes TaxID=68170 RepID=UPI0004C34F56|nr:RICIN domain-containing protein [Lentzea aerocolonigenes]MCP2245903.1 Ricin-type beta-trefoil lectin domain-containing protein [Lentzea aerocolonigenes]
MRRRITTSALAFVAAVAGTVGAAAPALADDHFDVTIRSSVSGKCLQPQGGSWADGAVVVQVQCDRNNAFQRWDFIDHDDHIFEIRNAVTLKCLDVQGGAANGTSVGQWPCNRSSNERWQAGRDLPDFVTLKSRVAGTKTHCLDVPGGRTDEGLAVQIWVCNGTVSQAFGVFPV